MAPPQKNHKRISSITSDTCVHETIVEYKANGDIKVKTTKTVNTTVTDAADTNKNTGGLAEFLGQLALTPKKAKKALPAPKDTLFSPKHATFAGKKALPAPKKTLPAAKKKAAARNKSPSINEKVRRLSISLLQAAQENRGGDDDDEEEEDSSEEESSEQEESSEEECMKKRGRGYGRGYKK